MGKRFASFYRCLAFARFWKVKFWRWFTKCQYINDGWTDFHKNIYLYIFILGFFWKPEKLGSHTGSKWWPGDPDMKNDPNDPLTRWPNDPVPCLIHEMLCSVHRCVACASRCRHDCNSLVWIFTFVHNGQDYQYLEKADFFLSPRTKLKISLFCHTKCNDNPLSTRWRK